MTAQAHDEFVYKGKKYSIVPDLVSINELGLQPISENTACWRGYIACFCLLNDKLVLKHLSTNNGNRKDGPAPVINGVKPEIIEPVGLVDGYREFRNLKYKDVNLPLDYTGTIVLKDGFIRERYVHMGFQDTMNYATVIELTFENGILKSEKDRSKEMEERRSKGEDGIDPLRYG